MWKGVKLANSLGVHADDVTVDGHIGTKQPLEDYAELITPLSRPFRHAHAELQAVRRSIAVPKLCARLSVKPRGTDFEWMRRTLTIGTIL